MRVRIFIIFIFFSGMNFSLLAKNPFKELLPQKIEPQKATPQRLKEPETTELSGLKIEGIFWDTPLPQAIINGEVYKEGDIIKRFNAQITEIRKDGVSIIYRGRVFILSPEKKEKEEE